VRTIELMFDAAFQTALRVLEPFALDGADASGACRKEALAALRVVHGGLDALEAGLLAGLDTSTAIEVLTAGGTSARQARKIAARAVTLAGSAELTAGLARGEVSGEQVDSVAHVASGLEPEVRLALLSMGEGRPVAAPRSRQSTARRQPRPTARPARRPPHLRRTRLHRRLRLVPDPPPVRLARRRVDRPGQLGPGVPTPPPHGPRRRMELELGPRTASHLPPAAHPRPLSATRTRRVAPATADGG
jgi:hypothetical protein